MYNNGENHSIGQGGPECPSLYPPTGFNANFTSRRRLLKKEELAGKFGFVDKINPQQVSHQLNIDFRLGIS